jgi:glutathione S-transferase
MQLIGQFDSPFVRRVGLALTRYGMAFAHLPFGCFGDADRFAAHNPLRRVPTLVLESGEALIDSQAILDHLDEIHGRERALIAASGPERRAALRRCALATGVADKAVNFFYARTFATGLDPAFTARSEGQIRDGLALLDRECAERRRLVVRRATRPRRHRRRLRRALRQRGLCLSGRSQRLSGAGRSFGARRSAAGVSGDKPGVHPAGLRRRSSPSRGGGRPQG